MWGYLTDYHCQSREVQNRLLVNINVIELKKISLSLFLNTYIYLIASYACRRTWNRKICKWCSMMRKKKVFLNKSLHHIKPLRFYWKYLQSDQDYDCESGENQHCDFPEKAQTSDIKLFFTRLHWDWRNPYLGLKIIWLWIISDTKEGRFLIP